MILKKRKKFLCITLAVLAAGLIFFALWGVDYMLYGRSMRYCNAEILEFYHDQAYVYMQPLEPTKDDNVTLRIRTLHGNVRKAYVRYTLDVEAVSQADAEYHEVKMVFDCKDETGYYDYFVGIIPAQTSPYRYHFKLVNDRETLYVNGQNSYSVNKEFATVSNDYYVMPGFTTPDWAKGAVWYSIMPDSFYNGDLLNDNLNSGGVTQNVWGNNHYGSNDWFGGDLQGIMDKIEYLKSWNVEAVFINPIWLTTHQAGYGSFDLTQVNAALGNEKKLRELVDLLHDNGIKIMLDAVFRYTNATGNLYNSADYFPYVTDERGILMDGKNVGDLFYEMFQRNDSGEPIMEWGGPVFDFSSPVTRKYLYSAVNSVLQYYLDKFDIDGWRMDVGNSLSGTVTDEWQTSEQILKDMRAYIKKYGDDKLFLSEHGTGNLIYDYTLDSIWTHYAYAEPVRSYITNKKSENILMDSLYGAIVKLPRPIANSLYNYTASHDLSKTANLTDDVNRILAANLLTMTYVGSPAILFGDEVGMKGSANPGVSSMAPSSFGSMCWDESEWNDRITNNLRAVSQVRKDYRDVFTDGAYVTLMTDIQKHLIAFARFNQAGAVVTVTNVNNATAKGVALEVRRAGIKDGTTLYDALSGKAYKVKKGYVTIDVLAGGALLTQSSGSGYVAGLQKYAVGGGTGDISSTEIGALQLNGKVESTQSGFKGLFAGQTVGGNAELAFRYKGGDITAAFIADEEGKNGYFLQISSNEAKIVTYVNGSKNQIKSFAVSDGDILYIIRNDDNRFTVKKGSQEIDGASVHVAMNATVFAGVGGNGNVEALSISLSESQLSSEFIDDIGTQYTAYGTQPDFSQGKLTLRADEGMSGIYSKIHLGDFSYTASINSIVSGEAGLMLGYDKEDCISFTLKDGQLSFALTTGGSSWVISTAECALDKVMLAVEKIGSNYTALYSADGENWQALPNSINVNFSELYVGIFVTGEASFERTEIGDGQSRSAYRNYGEIDLISAESSGLAPNKLSVEEGTWTSVAGGYATGKARAALSGSELFGDFKVDVTMVLTELDADGYFGVAFGAYRVIASGSEKLQFFKGTQLVSEKQIGKLVAGQYRLLIINRDGTQSVWWGNDPVLMITENMITVPSKIRYISEGAVLAVTSHSECAYGGDWLNGVGSVNVIKSIDGDKSGTTVSLSSDGDYAYGAMLNQGYTDLFFSGNVMLSKTSIIKNAKFGLIIAGNVGATHQQAGCLISVDSAGNIRLEDKNGEIVSAASTYNSDSFYLIVIVQNNNLKVFVDDYAEIFTPSTQPVLEYTMEGLRGGTMNFYAEYAKVRVKNAFAYALKADEDYTTLSGYTERLIQQPPLPEPDVSQSEIAKSVSVQFNTREDVAMFHKYSGGEWEYGNGILSGYPGKENWNQGATLAAGQTSEEFDVQVDLKMNGSGFAGILIGKNAPTANHEVSGILIHIGYTGEIDIYDGTDRYHLSANVNVDGFTTLKVSQRIVDGKHVVSIFRGNSLTAELSFAIEDTQRQSAISGYVSLVCGTYGSGYGEFKNFSYTKVN